MKLIVEAPFTVKEQKEKEIKEQVSKQLDKYHMNITQANVFFKIDTGDVGDLIRAEVELHLPGPVIFASDDAQNFMDAFTGALNKVERQLRKSKDKKQSHQ